MLRILATLVCLPVLALWGLFSLFLAVFKCDENCSGDQAEAWQYTGQAILAFPGIAVGVAALILCFTPHRTAFRVAAVLAVGCALAWWLWLATGSF